MKLFPIAKINLGLNVVERRPDGYHNLKTVFYPVNIKDTLEVTPQANPATAHAAPTTAQATPATALAPPATALAAPTPEVSTSGPLNDCQLSISGITIEGDTQRNLVVRAYHLLKDDFPGLPPVTVHLHKAIPTQAGMGGGSSDCAYMIRLLNEQFRLGLTTEQMQQYAARLGADCAFFILAQPAYAEGIGERLEPIALDLSRYHIGVVRPDIPVPTKEAFSLIRPHRPQKNCRDIVMQPVETWRDELVNDFEQSVFALHPEIGAIKEQLYRLGAVYAAMSGSGSAVFGLFRDPLKLNTEFPGMYTYCGTLRP